MREVLENYDYKKYIDECRMKYFPINDVYIWGTKQLGQFCYRELKKNNINVLAFVDNDKKKQNEKIDGCKIISPESLDNSSLIIICSYYAYDIEQQIKSKGKNPYIIYEVLPLLDKRFAHYNFSYINLFQNIMKYKEQFLKLYECYSDEKSVQVLDNVLRYRMSLDSIYAKRALELSVGDGSSQYFDKNIMRFGNQESFIDCGGYNGDSSIEFIKKCPQYKEISFFEPDSILLNEAKNNLSRYNNINYIMAGTGSENKVVKFDKLNSIGGGVISNQGTTEIKIVSLDSVKFEYPPTFIKMDIEGSEMETLEGARNLIISKKPKLAISVYHKPKDLFDIMNYIRMLVPEYKFYLRHYTAGLADTVMYCII